MKSLRLVALAAATMFLLLSGSVHAQTNVNEEQGIKPHDVLHGGEFDSVSLTSGGLALHIGLDSLTVSRG